MEKQMDVRQAMNALINLMDNGLMPEPVRAGAAEGLGLIGGSEARAALAKIMEDGLKPPSLRAAAARALGMASKAG